jgi:hypothetical protein
MHPVKKARSAERITQSYLARKPRTIRSFYADVGEIPGGWLINRAGHVISGSLGRERIEVFAKPERLIEDFANSAPTPDAMVRFTKRYGVLHRDDVDYVDTGAGERIETDDFLIHAEQWSLTQKRFRSEWETVKPDEERAENLSSQIAPQVPAGRVVRAFVKPSKKGFHLELQPDDLQGALWLAFIAFSDKARKCQNPKCDAPYFLASRRDQKFCTERCSRLVANRRWWDKNGPEWRRQSK